MAVRTGSRFVAVSALAGIIGPIAFTVTVIVLGLLWQGYNHLTQAISELGATNAPNMNIQAINFVIFGILTVTFALGLWYHNTAFRNCSILVAAYGIGAIVVGPFHCDPGCPVSTNSTMQIVHNVDAFIAFVGLAITPLLFWRSARSIPSWRNIASWSARLAGLSVPLTFAYIVIAAFSLSASTGLLQRIFLGSLYGWLLIVAVRLLQINRKL